MIIIINKTDLKEKYLVIGFVIIWLMMQVMIFIQNGIVTNLESTKYINEAHYFLKNGKFSTHNFLFYSTEILLIALAFKLKISFLFIVLFQIIMNGLSILCFYKIVYRISENKFVVWFSTFYFLIFYYYHLYNTYLFTESLFFSFSIIFSWFLFTRKSISLTSSIFIILGLAILYLTRPTGIFFIPATYIFYPKKAFKFLLLSGIFLIAALFFIFNYSLGSGGEFNFLMPYQNEIIICGVPTMSIHHQISIPVEKNSIQGLFYIITHYSDLVFKLVIKRMNAFFGLSRSYYSLLHNIILCFYFYFIYFIILFGIRNLFRKHIAEVWFSIIIIGLMAVTVALSCDEWSNRFILSVLPFFLILAVTSVSNRMYKECQPDSN